MYCRVRIFLKPVFALAASCISIFLADRSINGKWSPAARIKTCIWSAFKGIDDINEAEKFKGAWLRVPRSEKVDLEEDEYYFHEIIGCHVLTEDGESIGTVTEIWQPGANDVWVVKTADKRDVLIPAVSEVVLDVDGDKKRS